MNATILFDSADLDRVAAISTRAFVVIGCYIGAVVVLNIWAQRSRNKRLRGLVAKMTPRFMGLIFAGLVATASPVSAQTSSTDSTTDLPVMTVVTTTPPTTQPSPSPSQPSTSAPTMKVVSAPVGPLTWMPWMQSGSTATHQTSDRVVSTDQTTQPSVPTFESEALPEPAPDARVEETSVAPTASAVHLVAPGEHFWSIARTVLESGGVTDPSEPEVTRYWAQLVEANRHRLIDPHNTDLIMPGQELVLPPIG